MELDLKELRNIDGLDGLDDDVVSHPPTILQNVNNNYENRDIDVKSDYELVRRNLHYQAQMLLEASKIFLESAKNADSPRYIEAFTSLMGQMSSTNEKILKIHKDIKEAKEVKEVTAVTEDTNYTYMSTSDLLEQSGGAQEIAMEGE